MLRLGYFSIYKRLWITLYCYQNSRTMKSEVLQTVGLNRTLYEAITFSEVTLFVDDTNLFQFGDCVKSLNDNINADLLSTQMVKLS